MSDVIPGQAQPAADPVAMISALLDKENVTPNSKTEAPAAQAEAPPQPETEGEHVPANNAEVEGADAKEGGEAEAEKAAVAEIPLDQLEAIELEVEVSGEGGKVTEKLPIKELKLGYMRQKDYSQKTAEVARQREEVGQKVRQAIDSERTQYQQSLQALQSALVEAVAPELKNVDWNNLATNDPFEYVKLRNRAEQIGNVLNAIEQKKTEAKTKADADRQASLTEQATKSWGTLQTDIPGWNEELYQNVLKAGEAVGYTTQETSNWLDARAIKLLHKAHLYDQLKAGQPPAAKKVVTAPKAVAPSATPAVPKRQQQSRNALERLGKSGKLDDLSAFIATQL